jgi:Uma2 family endonuclease
MNEDEYLQLCADNPGLRIERTTEGNIIVRRGAPTSQAPS